jgi:hypothetical protein
MAVLSLPMPWRWAVPISWAALLSIEAMIAPRNVVGDGVPHASSVSHAVPNQPGSYCAARDEEPSQTAWYGPHHVHGRPVGPKSPIRIAATPMPIPPTVPPMTTVPTPPASLASAERIARHVPVPVPRAPLRYRFRNSAGLRHDAADHQQG